jgi:parallel beta-helix repeat protein
MYFLRLIIVVAVPLVFSQAAAETWYVDATSGMRGNGSSRSPFAGLQTAIDAAQSGDTIRLAAGDYNADPVAFTDDLCGNCLEHKTPVAATRGILVEGKALCICGGGSDQTRLITGAGYGVFFLNSPGSVLQDLKITGGVRDKDGNATDAAIVARQSRVIVQRCAISDNEYRDSSVVVGVGGIFGREGAELHILNNTIENNGWDGVALYRGATATISGNVIRKGRGAGVGITWDAIATVIANDVSEYWKGIGSFGNTRVIARNNRVHHNLGWGIIATGTSFMDATNNAVVRNGNCGMALWGDSVQGRFANNLVYQNGWRKQWVCPCVGIWNYGQPSGFAVTNNLVFANEKGNYKAVEFDEDKPGPQYDLTGQFGNLSVDPMLSDTLLYRPLLTSPLINAGDTLLSDPDGTRSDIGVFGGPGANPD